jgi:hypothetical protein
MAGSVFELPQQFRLVNGGAQKYDIRQQFPLTSAISGQRPGVTGPAVGLTTFQWQDSNDWWIPSLSYFVLRGHFLDGSGNALARPPTGVIGYADNWPALLWSQIQMFCNSQTVELLQNSAQADTAVAYSSVDRTFLKTTATASGMGEALQKRILNSAQFGTAGVGASNYNEVTATWRPALSLFDCSEALPPGAQFRIDFSWALGGEQAMIESAIGAKLAGTDYTFTLDELTMYRATVAPDPLLVELPMQGLVEMNPVQVNTYQLTGGTSLQINSPMPSTCNRVLIAFQDNNSANNLAHGQNGLKPLSNFALRFSNGASDLASTIQNLYCSFTDLGYQAPNPTYAFTSLASAGARSGFERAYQDWVSICRGSSGGYEGSLPFGNADTGVGAQVNAPLLTGGGPIIQAGDPDNDQQFAIWTNGAGASTYTATSAAATSLYGWLGRMPIFAFPVVRPAGKLVSTMTVSLQLTSAVTSIQMFVIMSYSAALAVDRRPDGKYDYQVVRGD